MPSFVEILARIEGSRRPSAGHEGGKLRLVRVFGRNLHRQPPNGWLGMICQSADPADRRIAELRLRTAHESQGHEQPMLFVRLNGPIEQLIRSEEHKSELQYLMPI